MMSPGAMIARLHAQAEEDDGSDGAQRKWNE